MSKLQQVLRQQRPHENHTVNSFLSAFVYDMAADHVFQVFPVVGVDPPS
jgi:hypothetical protein